MIIIEDKIENEKLINSDDISSWWVLTKPSSVVWDNYIIQAGDWFYPLKF